MSDFSSSHRQKMMWETRNTWHAWFTSCIWLIQDQIISQFSPKSATLGYDLFCLWPEYKSCVHTCTNKPLQSRKCTRILYKWIKCFICEQTLNEALNNISVSHKHTHTLSHSLSVCVSLSSLFPSLSLSVYLSLSLHLSIFLQINNVFRAPTHHILHMCLSVCVCVMVFQ